MTSSVEQFIHDQNLKNFKKRLEAATDEAQRKMLLALLAEEETKAEQWMRQKLEKLDHRAAP